MSATLVATATGRFVWRDLMSTDPNRSLEFFTQLFGWSVKPFDMGPMGIYQMLSNGEQGLGGIVPLNAEHGRPSYWASYITVANVDKTAAQAAALGGTVVVQPTDIPDVGRFCVVIDPQGATFMPFTDKVETPEQDGPVPPGSVVWNELVTADVEGAKAFYSALFGWTTQEMPMGDGTYTLLKRGERSEGGLFQKPAEVPVSMWVIYFGVADIDRSMSDVARLGGRQTGPIMPVPDIGRVGWATDPTGATFALIQPER